MFIYMTNRVYLVNVELFMHKCRFCVHWKFEGTSLVTAIGILYIANINLSTDTSVDFALLIGLLGCFMHASCCVFPTKICPEL